MPLNIRDNTYNVRPTAYRVTITASSLDQTTGNGAGFVDPQKAETYGKRIDIAGATSTPTTTNTHDFYLNGVRIIFTTGGGLNLAGIISTINAYRPETGVMALESPTNFLTLRNAPGFEGKSIKIAAGTTGTFLSSVGITAGNYNTWPVITGTALAPTVTAANTLLINDITITLTSTTLAQTIIDINGSSNLTGVVASASGTRIRLAPVDASDSPYGGKVMRLANGTGTPLTALGLTAGYVRNLPSSVANSTNKVRGNLRWEQILRTLQGNTNITIGDIDKTGGTPDADPTVIAFTVVVDHPTALETADESNAGQTLVGLYAVKRLVARTLAQTFQSSRDIFNPLGVSYYGMTNTQNVTVGACASTISVADAAVAVTLLNV